MLVASSRVRWTTNASVRIYRCDSNAMRLCIDALPFFLWTILSLLFFGKYAADECTTTIERHNFGHGKRESEKEANPSDNLARMR